MGTESRVVRQFTEAERKKYAEKNSIGWDADGNHVTNPCAQCGESSRYLHNKKWWCLEHFKEEYARNP